MSLLHLSVYKRLYCLFTYNSKMSDITHSLLNIKFVKWLRFKRQPQDQSQQPRLDSDPMPFAASLPPLSFSSLKKN